MKQLGKKQETTKRDYDHVFELEQAWPSGSDSNVFALLAYLSHESPKVRALAALAIGEYLPVIMDRTLRIYDKVEASPSTGYLVDKVTAAFTVLLETERDADVLEKIGIALGNADTLISVERFRGIVAKANNDALRAIARGLDVLRPTPHLKALMTAVEETIAERQA